MCWYIRTEVDASDLVVRNPWREFRNVGTQMPQQYLKPQNFIAAGKYSGDTISAVFIP